MLKIKKKVNASKQTQEQQIVTLMHKVTVVLKRYQSKITLVAAALAALLVIAVGYTFIRSQQEQKAGPLLSSAYEVYSASGGSAADYQKALELFRDVQKKYPGTLSGSIAQFYIGNCLAMNGQAEAALKEYQAYISHYSENKFMTSLVYQRMGYVYSILGKQEDAIKAFEHAESSGGPGVATIELARLYETSGNKTESQKKYKTVQEKLGGTTWGIEAMGKLQTIAPAPAIGKEQK